jgi:hypothetical protein
VNIAIEVVPFLLRDDALRDRGTYHHPIAVPEAEDRLRPQLGSKGAPWRVQASESQYLPHPGQPAEMQIDVIRREASYQRLDICHQDFQAGELRIKSASYPSAPRSAPCQVHPSSPPAHYYLPTFLPLGASAPPGSRLVMPSGTCHPVPSCGQVVTTNCTSWRLRHGSQSLDLRLCSGKQARGGGLEPPMTGPEPVVLPITPPPKGVRAL